MSWFNDLPPDSSGRLERIDVWYFDDFELFHAGPARVTRYASPPPLANLAFYRRHRSTDLWLYVNTGTVVTTIPGYASQQWWQWQSTTTPGHFNAIGLIYTLDPAGRAPR